MWALAVNLICLFVTVAITLKNRSNFTHPAGIIAFGLLAPFYYSAVSFMAIFCHFRELVRYSNWNQRRGRTRSKVAGHSLSVAITFLSCPYRVWL